MTNDTTMITIQWIDDDDPYTATVAYMGPITVQRKVDLGPNPTWPSPSEANSMLAEAVREVLDEAWEALTGTPIDRRGDDDA